jgi:hypothetical protein
LMFGVRFIFNRVLNSIIIFHWRDGPRSIFSTWRNIPDWSIRWRCGRRSQIASYIRLPLQVRMSRLYRFLLSFAWIVFIRRHGHIWIAATFKLLTLSRYLSKKANCCFPSAFFVVKLQHSPLLSV